MCLSRTQTARENALLTLVVNGIGEFLLRVLFDPSFTSSLCLIGTNSLTGSNAHNV